MIRIDDGGRARLWALKQAAKCTTPESVQQRIAQERESLRTLRVSGVSRRAAWAVQAHPALIRVLSQRSDQKLHRSVRRSRPQVNGPLNSKGPDQAIDRSCSLAVEAESAGAKARRKKRRKMARVSLSTFWDRVGYGHGRYNTRRSTAAQPDFPLPVRRRLGWDIPNRR